MPSAVSSSAIFGPMPSIVVNLSALAAAGFLAAGALAGAAALAGAFAANRSRSCAYSWIYNCH